MKKNVGSLDTIVRLILAIVIAVLFVTDVISGTLGIILVVAAGILFLTGIFGRCGLYSLFGITTCKARK